MPKTPLTLVKSPKKTRAAEILAIAEADFAFDENEVLRMMGGSAANGCNEDPVVFTGKAEPTIRQMVSKYCFDRVPLTYGEFQGMLLYCAALDIISGDGVVRDALKKDWSRPGAALWAKHRSEWAPAGPLYLAGDMDGLWKYHKDTDALTRIGKGFSEFSDF